MSRRTCRSPGGDGGVRHDEVEIGGRRDRASSRACTQPTEFAVEPDASSASYPLAAAAIVGGAVAVRGLGVDVAAGRRPLRRRAGVDGLHHVAPATDTVVDAPPRHAAARHRRRHGRLSDLVPTLAAVATLAVTPTRIRGVGFIRAQGERPARRPRAPSCARLGAAVIVETDDGLRHPSDRPAQRRHARTPTTTTAWRWRSGARARRRRDRGRRSDVVSKSWPGFWDVLDAIPATSHVTRIAAFDLDGTLTTRDCVVPFLRQVAGRRGSSRASPPTRSTRRGRSSAATATRSRRCASHAAFAGRALGRCRAAARVEFAAMVQANWMRRDTAAQSGWHLQPGDQVVIVSASYAIYVEPLAVLARRRPGVWRRARGRGGRQVTGELDGPNCRGPEKVRRLHAWLDTSTADDADGRPDRLRRFARRP